MLKAQSLAELEAIIVTRKDMDDECVDGGILSKELEQYEMLFQNGELRAHLDLRSL